MLHVGTSSLLACGPEFEEVEVVDLTKAAEHRRADYEYVDDGQTCLFDILDTAGEGDRAISFLFFSFFFFFFF
jgi:hypothetical protein